MHGMHFIVVRIACNAFAWDTLHRIGTRYKVTILRDDCNSSTAKGRNDIAI